jgi:hypothetical protein
MGDTKPVMEGELTLQVARLLGPLLSEMGAEVSFVRSQSGPSTPLRPEDLLPRAAQNTPPTQTTPPETLSQKDPQTEADLLFYRISEIRHRARLVNEQLHPDVVVCLHFNAEDWGNPLKPELTEGNHLHTLVNGCYSAQELRLDDLRCEMLWRLLSRVIHEEIALSESVASSLASATVLPPFQYRGTNARPLGDGAHVWARNLLANRLYRCPVLFLEPYVMNNREVWERVQAGDFSGLRKVGGKLQPSIFREYAEAVANGLRQYAVSVRKTPSPTSP